jgi:hypothetical protein
MTLTFMGKRSATSRASGSAVQRIREFNRFYARVLGLQRPELAGSAFRRTQARGLYELSQGDAVSTDLRRSTRPNSLSSSRP